MYLVDLPRRDSEIVYSCMHHFYVDTYAVLVAPPGVVLMNVGILQ